MIYRSLAVLAIIVTSMSSYADATNDEILNEIKALRKEVSELKAEIAKKNREQTSTPVIQPQAIAVKMPDIKKLEKITLKENPSKDDVCEYFDKIDELSSQQNRFSYSEDPQCKMIMMAGKENADIILERLNDRNNICQGYYKEALKRLADDKIKEMVFKKLSSNPFLIDIIQDMHWQNDAKDIVLDQYKRNCGILQWLSVVASYRVPETYPDLKRVFFDSRNNQAHIYKILSGIPEITFTKAEIDRVWNKIKTQDQFSMASFGVIAASYGNRDAFDTLFNLMQRKDEQSTWIKDSLRTKIYDILDCDVPYSELPAWYEKNKDKFVFDENSKRFVIKN